jgi:hypothetical protein
MAVQIASLRLDCRKCSAADKINFGCENSPPDPARWEFSEGVFLDRCPLKLITNQSFELFKYYNFYKEGYLFNEGTISHQPAKMIEAFRIFEDEELELRKENEQHEQP